MYMLVLAALNDVISTL